MASLKSKLIKYLKKYRGSYAPGQDLARLFSVRPSAVTNILAGLVEDELVDTISIKKYSCRACIGYRWVGGKNES